MTTFIAIHSGKGGVGKTTVAINLAHALYERKKKVMLVDGNLDTPHVGLYLGLQNPDHHLHQFLDGKKDIKNTVYTHESGLRFIPTTSTPNTSHQNIHELFEHLDDTCDFVLIDCPSGFSLVVHEILKHADESIIITTPTMSAVYDAGKTLHLAEEYGHAIAAIILNHANLKEPGINERSPVKCTNAKR